MSIRIRSDRPAAYFEGTPHELSPYGYAPLRDFSSRLTQLCGFKECSTTYQNTI